MGRRRTHDEQTRAALRAAAERLVAEGGPAALSVRAVAAEAGTTTRAVYSLFGSMDGLLVDALAQDAYERLATGLEQLPQTDDPIEDLVTVGVSVFRPLVLEHPVLYRVTFQRVLPGMQLGPELTASRERALNLLLARIQRLQDAGLLGGRTPRQAEVAYNAMLEGLANAELRGDAYRLLPVGEEEDTWRDSLKTLLSGFAVNP
jgi:AcrR family transcriptional regulator